MNDKVNVEIIIPEIEMSYNLFIPINKKIGTIKKLVNKSITELTTGRFPIIPTMQLYNGETLQRYTDNELIYSTDIRNGTRLIVLSNLY